METSLLTDLEIKGDDVDEFFSYLIKDFNIDVKKLDLSRSIWVKNLLIL
jgi:hypothetical protein